MILYADQGWRDIHNIPTRQHCSLVCTQIIIVGVAILVAVAIIIIAITIVIVTFIVVGVKMGKAAMEILKKIKLVERNTSSAVVSTFAITMVHVFTVRFRCHLHFRCI
ncbi:hypothetical protein BCR41DRAFT_355795 [Lobosporangium transversale]|uniref:Uncharacterized protein n=1 Tax=Lobosporangium transversale TaxID=64571 RepID=A0A1Y2GM05_9FUNG|nr:hypothetical protein BCR41DRAFT_355795 [Lobosporangium transversale]ORZ13451.1 hypothetical protein BCR41DRAFT_355795 [Lobosporangium transversale]|eukprot:XP_021880532.1 hypothetical protein BCR41DRAFT_355795 [Lobosporangium transversale]